MRVATGLALSGAIAVAVVGLVGGNGGSNEEEGMADVRPLTAAEWQAFADRRIVFGHQSVGGNILAGLEDLARGQGGTFRIVESREGGEGANVLHFRVGRNEDPISKIEDFSAAIDEGAGAGADVAILKICYVDIHPGTDAAALADRYIAALDALQAAHPEIRFVAVTAPLTNRQEGWKARLKMLMGRTPAGYEANLRRLEFNDRVRARYQGTGRLFDLARVESEASVFEYAGRKVESMNAAFTDDGGHLNEEGRRRVATALVRFLAAPGD